MKELFVCNSLLGSGSQHQSFQRKFLAQKATLQARGSLTHGRWRNAGAWIWAGPSETLVSTLSSLVRMNFCVCVSAGRGADLTEGPEPPRGPQPAPYGPGGPFPYCHGSGCNSSRCLSSQPSARTLTALLFLSILFHGPT